MKHSLKLAVLLAVAMAVPAAMAQGPGATIYKSKCEMCHGPNGQAATPMAKMMKVPPFDPANLKKETDAEVASIIANGKAKMPGYKGQLSGKQIKNLVAYIRTLEKK